MKLSDLPSRPPVCCRLHLHRWSGYYPRPLWHLGEYPWETWQHVCIAHYKSCTRCGYTRRSFFKNRECVGVWVVPLNKQPHKPSKLEIDKASEVLMKKYT